MIHRLLEHAKRFGLFQAIRLIELNALRTGRISGKNGLIGTNASPTAEPLRLGAVAKSRFAGTQTEVIMPDSGRKRSRRNRASSRTTATANRLKVTTPAIGLTGPTGVLPRHYTSLLIARQKQHDYAMTDFYDLFNHRLISLFYRAWAKHRLPLCYENSQLDQRIVDSPTTLLNSLVGQGIPELQSRNTYPDGTLLMFAGLFSATRRTADGLETILRVGLRRTIQIKQFQPQWLNLETEERTRLGGRSGSAGGSGSGGFNNQLGRSAICGERAFDVQSRFRIVVSAVSYNEFADFLPGQPKLDVVRELTRRYVGMEFDFDVQVALDGTQIPECRLGELNNTGPRLGRNCWMKSQPIHGVVGDAIFTVPDAA